MKYKSDAVKVALITFFLIWAGIIFISYECHAVSFDCDKAASFAEKMICEDNSLSTLDDDLNIAYKAALSLVPDKQALKESQRKWAKEERGKCRDVKCLELIHTKRISELKALISKNNKKTTNNSNSSPIVEKKYPPYPDVWGVELPVYGYSPEYKLVSKMHDGDIFLSYVKERKERSGTVLGLYTYAWLFFSQRYGRVAE